MGKRQEKKESNISKQVEEPIKFEEPEILTKEQQAQRDRRLKIKSMKVRTTMGFVILFSVLFIMTLGHTYTILAIAGTTCTMYFEVMRVNDIPELYNQCRMRRFQWLLYFFSLFIFAPHLILKRSLLDYYFPYSNDTILHKVFFDYHLLIAFCFLNLIIILIVLNLIKHGNFQYQVRTLAKCSIAALIFASTAACYSYIIKLGYFWFLFSVLAVACNDAMAYFFGQALGRTPLIKLSPKKTVEGFVGGIFGTLVWCFFSSIWFAKFEFLVCPQPQYQFSFFEELNCNHHDIYIVKPHHIKLGPLGSFHYDIANVQFYALGISLFASLIAPFGGFLASGFKRAFKIKDFADTIPGHGGITDRMDCKVMMSWFVYLYLSQLVFKEQNHVENAYKSFQGMNYQDQQNFMSQFSNLLSMANITGQ